MRCFHAAHKCLTFIAIRCDATENNGSAESEPGAPTDIPSFKTLDKQEAVPFHVLLLLSETPVALG